MRSMNDARLWAAMSMYLRRQLPEHAQLPGGAPDTVARHLVAIVRRERGEHRTWAPGEALPSPPPPGVVDVDGCAWFVDRDAGLGCYRMCAVDQADLAESTTDVDGVRVWPYLLDSDGPLTEHPPPTAAELDTLHVLLARYVRTDLAEAIEADSEAVAEVVEIGRRFSGGDEVSFGFELDVLDDALPVAERAEVTGALHPARAFARHLAEQVTSRGNRLRDE